MLSARTIASVCPRLLAILADEELYHSSIRGTFDKIPHPMATTVPQPTLAKYLRALWSDWLTRMCGALSVPFAAVAVMLRGPSRILWGVLAVAAFVFASYRVWREERNIRLKETGDLKAQIVNLQRKPYDEELGRQASDLIAQLSGEGRILLRHLLEREPIEVGRRFRDEIMQDVQDGQMALMYQRGVVRHKESWLQNGHLIRTDYVITPQFREVLQDLLYPRE